MPVVSGVFGAGVLLVLGGLGLGAFTQSTKGIWLSGVGTVLVVIALFLVLGYNHTAYYPSLADMQSSLTIENSSGSRYTLVAMSYVSLMVPFVLAYIIVVWRAMDRKPMTIDEVQNDAHHY
jgi:cytochrome d ubiquinol oxidase subunit II